MWRTDSEQRSEHLIAIFLVYFIFSSLKKGKYRICREDKNPKTYPGNKPQSRPVGCGAESADPDS